MARPSSPSSEREPHRKRVKIFRACTTCVTSKTRCEDVNVDGCSICRRRARPCSLAGAAGSAVGGSKGTAPTPSATPDGYSWTTPPPTDGTVEDLRRRLSEAERRVAHTQSSLTKLQEHVRDLASVDHHMSEIVSVPENVRERKSGTSGAIRLASSVLFPLDETMFNVSSGRTYPDAIARGLIPASHVELALHAFKHRFSRLLPLTPFLTVTSRLPNHNFVVLAALHHVPSAYNARLAPLVAESLLLTMSGAGSIDVILALLILSLAPEIVDADPEIGTPSPSPLRLISIAFTMGQNLGLESKAEGALRRGEDLNSDLWAQPLWELQLWAAIVNRYTLLSLIYGQSVYLPPLIALRLPKLTREHAETCNEHLRAEADLLSIYLPFSKVITQLENRDDEYTVDSVSVLHGENSYKAALEKSAKFRTNQPVSLCNDSICLEFVFGLRIACLTRWIPSPFAAPRELALKCLSNLPAVMSTVLDIVLNGPLELTQLPAYTIMCVCVALISLRRAILFVSMTYPNARLIDISRLDDTEDALRTLSGSPRILFSQAEMAFSHIPGMSSSSWRFVPPVDSRLEGATSVADALPIDAPLPTLFDIDIMSWDLSMLFPEIPPGPFPNIPLQ